MPAYRQAGLSLGIQSRKPEGLKGLVALSVNPEKEKSRKQTPMLTIGVFRRVDKGVNLSNRRKMEEIDRFDILREMGSICAGNATVVISQLLGSKIELYMPSIDALSAEAVIGRVGSKGKIVIGIHVKIIVEAIGKLLLVFPEEDAFKLIDIFIKEPGEKPGVLTETGVSLIKEVAHIIICTYLGALSLLIKKLIIPSTPTLTSGPIEEVLNLVLKRNLDEEYLILTEAIFKEPIRNIQGCFYHIFPQSSAELILKIMREQVKTNP